MFKFIRTRDVAVPERGTSASAGIDFFIPNDFNEIILEPGKSICIPCGIKMVINASQCLLMVNKSGWGKKGLDVGACLIDSDYRGEVHLDIHNRGKQHIKLSPGLKIVQGIILPALNLQPEELNDDEFAVYENTERGTGGFGSTGLIWTGTGYKITRESGIKFETD